MNANELRDEGILVSVLKADQVTEDWSIKAFSALKHFAQCNRGEFMCEQVRQYAAAHLSLPEPPSKRAWGAVMLMGAKEGIIKQTGYGKTKSASAHRTPAAVWMTV